MHDLHCHILPGVDDGARDLDESLRMLKAAKAVGITSITCTPHCRDPWFDYEKMWAAYRLLCEHAGGFPLQMGFEVNHAKLMELGMGWAERLHYDGCAKFLLELQTAATEMDFREYERTIFELQGMGYEVIIAHPERYRAIQKNLDLAYDLMRMGCRLQASTDFLSRGARGGRAARKCAQRLFEERAYAYMASDAHRPEHYTDFAKARESYSLRGAHFANV